jgi:hypothetical protein
MRSISLAVLVAVAACADTSAPRSSVDPVATSASLEAVQHALAVPAVRSFTLFAPGIGPTRSLIAATSPYTSSARRALRLRELAPVLSAGVSLISIVPDTLRGSVFRWDSAASAYYRAATTGGPDNGVRFVLYAVGDSGRIVYPLVEVGYADLIDESTESSARLHIIVRDVAGAVTFVDYVIAITPAPNGFTAAADGAMTGALDFAVTVAATGSASAVTTAADAVLNVIEPATQIELHERSTFTVSSGATSIDFTIRPPGQSVRLQGLFTMTLVTPDSGVVTINATIRGNDEVMATVQGSPPDQLSFKDRDGNALPAGPVLDMLGQLMHAVDGVFQFIHGLFGPVGNVFGGI